MASSYDQLRVLSYRVVPGALAEIPCWRVLFPSRWRGPLTELGAEKNGGRSQRTNIPVDSLNSALRALMPGIIAVGADAHRDGERAWILAGRELDAGALLQIVRSWLAVHFGTCQGYEAVQRLLRAEDLRGSAARVPFDAGATAGGTANPGSLLFNLIPSALAAKLAASGRWDDAGQPRDLVRVVGGANSPAEVMTWPPYPYTRNDGEWHFSTVFRFSMQTVPFDAQPVINLEVVLRRWLRAGKDGFLRLPYGQDTTLYMRPRVPWIDASGEPECFQVAPVRSRKDGSEFRLEWRNWLGPIMTELAWPRLPDIRALEKDPTAEMQGPVAMAMVFDTGALPEHPVRPGWPAADRRRMFENISRRLADTLIAVPLLPRAHPHGSARRRRPMVPMPERPGDGEDLKKWLRERELKRAQVERRRQLESALARKCRVEILYQHADTLQALRDALTQLLGTPAQELGTRYEWRLGRLTLTATHRRLGAIGAELGGGERASSRNPIPDALGERMAAVSASLCHSAADGAIIELKGRDGFASAADDPKIALRKGAAIAGRVTQFMTPPRGAEASTRGHDDGNDLPHRARAVWRDLFRQLGVTTGPLDLLPGAAGVPTSLQFVGVWLLNHRSGRDRPALRIPAMVCLPASGPLRARIATPELPEWLPYPELLRRLGSLPRLHWHAWGEDSFAHFVRDALERDLLAEGPVMLMAEAQNFRRAWRWLQHANLAPDRIQLPPGSPRPAADWPGLRLVRLRVTSGGETPEGFGENGRATGYPKGMWRWNDRVYLSTAGKPDAMSGVSPAQSRLRSYRTSRREHRAAPDRVAWNPACLEITAASLQPGDDPLVWAGLAHQLRFAAWHFDDPLSLPLPLHLASKLEEYALPLER